jgi:nucleotide-binding universal stress UspA family protein
MEERTTKESSSPDRREGSPFRHILVPLDGSALAECALPFAAAIARALSGRITLLRVLELHREPGAGRQMDPVDWEIARAEAHSHLAEFESELKASGVASTVELVQGRPAEQIIQFAKEHEADLIVLSSHGEGGLSGWVLSSTAQKVVARAQTSVLIVPAYAHEEKRIGELRFDKILVPLDCSPRAESILPLATALARAYESKLILAHIVPEPEMPRRMPPSAEDVALAAQLTEHNRNAAEHYLSELQHRLSAQGVKPEVRMAVSPRRARSIRALAERENVDLVLVSAHGKTGDASERYGGIAARLIQESGRPVVILQDLPGIMHEATAAEEAARSHPGH